MSRQTRPPQELSQIDRDLHTWMESQPKIAEQQPETAASHSSEDLSARLAQAAFIGFNQAAVLPFIAYDKVKAWIHER